MTAPILGYKMLNRAAADLVAELESKVNMQKIEVIRDELYYSAEQRITDLGIAIPPSLRSLHAATGWAGMAVDETARRIKLMDYRIETEGYSDQLRAILKRNNIHSEFGMAKLDGLVTGRGYMSVGAPDVDGGPPIVAIESPQSFTTKWDARTRRMTAAFRLYRDNDKVTPLGTLYLPTVTIHVRKISIGWVEVARDEHGKGFVAAVALPHKPRSHDRNGQAFINRAMRDIIDSVCRTLLGTEIAREFFAAPMRYVMGSPQSAFKNKDGSDMEAWKAIMGRVWVVDVNEADKNPEAGQFPAMDPTAFTRLVEMYAKLFSSASGLPATYFSFAADNPISAEAMNVAEGRLAGNADACILDWSAPMEELARIVLDYAGIQPYDEYIDIESVWDKTMTPNVAQVTDAVSKEVASGIVSPSSDVARERLGYSPEQIARLNEEDRKYQAKQARLAIANGSRNNQSGQGGATGAGSSGSGSGSGNAAGVGQQSGS